MGADRIVLDEIVLEVMARPAWIPAVEQHHLFQPPSGHRQSGNDPGAEYELCELSPHAFDHRTLVRHALDFVDEIKCRMARVEHLVVHQMPPRAIPNAYSLTPPRSGLTGQPLPREDRPAAAARLGRKFARAHARS